MVSLRGTIRLLALSHNYIATQLLKIDGWAYRVLLELLVFILKSNLIQVVVIWIWSQISIICCSNLFCLVRSIFNILKVAISCLIIWIVASRTLAKPIRHFCLFLLRLIPLMHYLQLLNNMIQLSALIQRFSRDLKSFHKIQIVKFIVCQIMHVVLVILLVVT